MIYLHELVDTVPGRTDDYLDSVAEHHGSSAARAGRPATVLGLFTALAAAGRTPLAVNLWEYGDWNDVEAALDRQFEPKAQDPELKRWWLANVDRRTGGFDRLLESTSYTPEVREHRRRRTGASLFLHEIVRLRPGAAEDYLDALGSDGVSAVTESGAVFVGAFRVRLRGDEALTLLGFRSATDLGRFAASWHAEQSSGNLRRWRDREDDWVLGKDTLVLRARHFLKSPWHI